MFRLNEVESTEYCQIWTYRKGVFDFASIRSLCRNGRELPRSKKLKAAKEWRLTRLSKSHRLLTRQANTQGHVLAIALWRKDLDRVAAQIQCQNLCAEEAGQ